jgi:amidase
MTARPEIDTTRAHRLYGLLLNAATSGRQTDEAFAQKLKEAETIAADDWSAKARRLKGNVLRHRDWLVLNEERHKQRWKWHQFFQEYDLLLCPAFSTAAIRHNDVPSDMREIVINNRKWGYNEQLFWAGYTGMAYLPGTVAPIGFTSENLPVGVQIVGPQYGDRACIHFARLLEAEYQAFVPPPGYESV